MWASRARYKPRDKAKVEVAVLIASRWFLAVLRNRTFYSLDEMQAAVAELLEKLNHRKMRRLKKSRREDRRRRCQGDP